MDWDGLHIPGGICRVPGSDLRKFELHQMRAMQRPGRSYTDRGDGFAFYDVKKEKGLKGALEARDKPFEAYFPMPRPKGS